MPNISSRAPVGVEGGDGVGVRHLVRLRLGSLDHFLRLLRLGLADLLVGPAVEVHEVQGGELGRGGGPVALDSFGYTRGMAAHAIPVETPDEPPVAVYYGERAYTVDARDADAVRDLIRRKEQDLLPGVVGGFAALMYYLVQQEIRHDGQIFAHKNGDCSDFTRANLVPTTRRKHCYPQLALRPRAAGSLLQQQGVIKDGDYWRVRFRTEAGHVSLGRYQSRRVAERVLHAYRQGQLSICQQHRLDQALGHPLTRVHRGQLLRELGLRDRPPAPLRDQPSR